MFRRSRDGRRKSPVNKSLYDVWMYLFSRVAQATFLHIKSDIIRFKHEYYLLLDRDADFVDAIGKYGSDLIGVRNRYTKLMKLIGRYRND